MEKIRKNIVLVVLFGFGLAFAQTNEENAVSEIVEEKKDTTTVVTKRMKLDGIAAVIGDYVILDSDVEKTLIDLRNQGASKWKIVCMRTKLCKIVY